jgi:lysophospholipase L1-like esterase
MLGFKTQGDAAMLSFQHSLKRFAVVCAWSVLLLSTHATADSPAPAGAKKTAAKPNLGDFFKQHWIDRVKLFRKENKDLDLEFRNVILLGDSITEGFDVKKHFFFPKHRVLNRGIGADVIGNDLPKTDNRGLLRRLPESVFDCNPSDVFILIGINDLGSGHTPEVIEAGYHELLETIKQKAPKVRVHVQSVLPCRDRFAKHNTNVLDVHKRLQKLAKESGADYIDLHSKMTDDKGELKKDFTRDGLHLLAPGYAVWKTEIDRTMGW